MARSWRRRTRTGDASYQYGNPENARAHYRTTGPEILRDLPTITHSWPASAPPARGRTGRYRREQKPDVQIVAAEPAYGELVLRPAQPGRRFRARAVRPGGVDRRYSVGSLDAAAPDRELVEARGHSSPASPPAGAARRARRRGEGRRRAEPADIVLIVADAGWKYLSTGAYSGDLEERAADLDGQLWA